MMEWIETPESSTIVRIGYEEQQNILLIEFKRSSTYQYFDVPVSVFDQMKTAESKGQFFSQNVKGVFRYARL